MADPNITPAPTWQRLPTETPEEYQWFNHWLQMGPAWRADEQRSLFEVVRAFGLDLERLKDTSARNGWFTRGAAYDDGWVSKDVSKQIRARSIALSGQIALTGLELGLEAMRRIAVRVADDPADELSIPDIRALLEVSDKLARRAGGEADMTLSLAKPPSEMTDAELAESLRARGRPVPALLEG